MSGFGGLSCLVLMISISELTEVLVVVVVVVGGKPFMVGPPEGPTKM